MLEMLMLGISSSIAVIGTAAAIALGVGAAVAGGATAYATREAGKAEERAQQAAQQQAATQERIAREQMTATREMAEEARVAAQPTPEQQAFTQMMRTRAEAGLGAPEFVSTTEQETEKALEALQKYYMQRGFQPSPRETGLLIEPSQKVARDIAIQNALLKRQAQQQAWERAYALTPLQAEVIGQQAPLQALPTEAAGIQAGYGTMATGAAAPYTTQQALALGRMEQATEAQKALGGMLTAYASPLLQQRITAGGGAGRSILPEEEEEDFTQYAKFPRRF